MKAIFIILLLAIIGQIIPRRPIFRKNFFKRSMYKMQRQNRAQFLKRQMAMRMGGVRKMFKHIHHHRRQRQMPLKNLLSSALNIFPQIPKQLAAQQKNIKLEIIPIFEKVSAATQTSANDEIPMPIKQEEETTKDVPTCSVEVYELIKQVITLIEKKEYPELLKLLPGLVKAIKDCSSSFIHVSDKCKNDYSDMIDYTRKLLADVATLDHDSAKKDLNDIVTVAKKLPLECIPVPNYGELIQQVQDYSPCNADANDLVYDIYKHIDLKDWFALAKDIPLFVRTIKDCIKEHVGVNKQCKSDINDLKTHAMRLPKDLATFDLDKVKEDLNNVMNDLKKIKNDC